MRYGVSSSGRTDVLSGVEQAEAASVVMLARRWRCGYCGADPFEPCHRRGRPAAVLRMTHPERMRVIQAVMAREYERGVAAGLRIAATGERRKAVEASERADGE